MAVGGGRWRSAAVGGGRWRSVAVGGGRWRSVAVGAGRRWSVAFGGEHYVPVYQFLKETFFELKFIQHNQYMIQIQSVH